MLADKEVTARKDRRKRLRFWGEGIFLLAGAVVIVNALFVFSHYQPYNPQLATDGNSDRGFTAISYFGVDRTGTNDLIGAELLDEHLAALHRNGYVTVTGKDVQNYYQNGTPLPQNALFLNFEDGRRDTLIFAERLMEKYNYHGMISTYAENLDGQDNKFLRADELKDLTKNGYWELGTNGYRLYYINVFDRWNRYIGNMNPVVYSHLAAVLGRNYNHYLMDYIRDDKDFPVETYQVMKDRISTDYTLLQDTYMKDIGYVPETYTLMHANTGRFGNNDDVSKVNETWIRKLFKMNFNREGDSHNDRRSSIYDLTRVEPRAYWPVNHLLMRLKDDGNPDIVFINGDEDQYRHWDVRKGAAECKDEQIILTTESQGQGEMVLDNSRNFQDIHVTADLLGNQYGSQKLFLRTSPDQSSYIVIALVNNHFVAGECSNGTYRELQNTDLRLFDGIGYPSEDEDKKDTAVTERQVLARYAPDTAMAKKQLSNLQELSSQDARSVDEGSPEYHQPLSYHQRGKRQLDVSLHGNVLSVSLDGRPIADSTVMVAEPGQVILGAQWPGYGYSQTNLADDVYDAVFGGLKITQWRPDDGHDGEAQVLYDSHYTGWDKVRHRSRQYWRRLLDWVLAYF